MGYALVPESSVRTSIAAAAKIVSNYLVDAVGDLTDITPFCASGSTAHTAGYALMWELGLDGTTWTAIT